jgi:hypothetical protein
MNHPIRRIDSARVSLPCTLRRRVGAPISALTLEVGPGGMCVSSPRPLAPDEEVEMRISGHARVVRQQRLNVYALRFEGLPAPMERRLHAIAVNGR